MYEYFNKFPGRKWEIVHQYTLERLNVNVETLCSFVLAALPETTKIYWKDHAKIWKFILNLTFMDFRIHIEFHLVIANILKCWILKQGSEGFWVLLNLPVILRRFTLSKNFYCLTNNCSLNIFISFSGCNLNKLKWDKCYKGWARNIMHLRRNWQILSGCRNIFRLT